MTLVDRIIVLNAGSIEQIGSPMELYNQPFNQFIAGFIGLSKMNFIEAGRLGVTGASTVGVRPEHASIGERTGKLKGVVSHVECLGGDTNIYLDCMDIGLICVLLFGERDFKIGSEQTIRFEDARIYKFDKTTGLFIKALLVKSCRLLRPRKRVGRIIWSVFFNFV